MPTSAPCPPPATTLPSCMRRRPLMVTGCWLLLLVAVGMLALLPFAAFAQPSIPGSSQAGVACTSPLRVDSEATFHEAIGCVNQALTGTYQISLTADITYSEPLTSLVNPRLTQLTIEGNGHTLNAAGHGRVLVAAQLQALTLHQLTLTGGLGAAGEADNGGGLSLDCRDDLECHWRLTAVTVHNNQAIDGGGIHYRCSYHGGGSLLLEEVHLYANEAVEEGGGLFFSSDEDSRRCTLDLRNVLVEQNRARYGGGFRSYSPRITITNSTFRQNQASRDGGAILLRKSDGFITMLLRGTAIYDNEARRTGGGLNITSFEQNFAIQLVNSTISGNRVISGTGGGLYLSENDGSLQIDLINSTVVGNQAEVGGGVFIYNQEGGESASLYLANAIVATNTGGDCAGANTEDTRFPPFRGERVVSMGYNLDGDGSCLTPTVRRPFDHAAIDPRVAPLADNGGPTWTHALRPDSKAIGGGDDAVCAQPPVLRIDQRGHRRPEGQHCDIGAYEAVEERSLSPLYVSSSSSGFIGELLFNDEDILRYDRVSAQWSMLFDGSDVGIAADVDAFALLEDGTLVLSFDEPLDLPALGTVQPADIVQFQPTKLGNETTGSFAWFLDGSDVGLDDRTNVDALAFSSDGHLVVSLQQPFALAEVSGQDEDLLLLRDATFGATSSGRWQLYLDGSDVGLASGRDLNALWIDPLYGELYLTTSAPYTFTTLAGDADNIVVCKPIALGQGSACRFAPFWDGDAVGFDNERVDGIHVGLQPSSYDPTTVVGTGETSEALEEPPLTEEDEAPVAPVQELYLPLLRR